jgi:hypothetical protein
MLPTVDPTELVPLQFDFTYLLKDYPAATIVTTGSPRIAIELISGTDALPGSRLSSVPVVSGLVVTQFFQPNAAQTSATKYRVSCNIDVSGTNYKPTIAVDITVDKRVDS